MLQAAADRILTAEPDSHKVVARLESIEHDARRGDAIDRMFDLTVHVSDGGRNGSCLVRLEDRVIVPGSRLAAGQQIFSGEYESLAVGELTFTFIAMGGGELSCSTFVTGDENELHLGVQHFRLPLVLERASGERSEIVFRGRIDLA
ncbi:MAG: hypothetical protein R3C97_07095 [Geminicoccaceae bacterium]